MPVSRIRGIGPATAEILHHLDILTAGDLLSWWPRDWEDRTIHIPLSAFAQHSKVNTSAIVTGQEWFGFGRMRTLKIKITDDEGTEAELVCFNRPFLEKQFPVGTTVSIHGSFQIKYGNLQSTAFDIDPQGSAPAQVLPVYSLTAGIAQHQMRKLIQNAISEYGRGIESELSLEVRTACKLPSKPEILRMMHNPSSMAEAESAKNALIFEELFLFEYAIGKRCLERRGRLPAIEIRPPGDAQPIAHLTDLSFLTRLQSHILDRLPFSLTDDQLFVIKEMNADLGLPESVPSQASLTPKIPSMARLLQGDVGSGKTLVAFLAAIAVIEQGGQVVLLAPTELLARQHADNAAKLLESAGIRLAYLTGNVKSAGRSRLLGELEAGNIDLVIGTHALFSSGVSYRNLRLVVIDEQHRFGVLQRGAIIEKGTASNPSKIPPHLIMMSATPIPRTLALSVFGDLDVSVIRTMPPGRKPIVTHLARQGNEKKVYDFIGRELQAGRQAYFVYPLIGESDVISLKSATAMFEEISQRIYPGTASALIHSGIAEEEQRSIMENFRSGNIRILVATSVVEVGVDVANATCMVIEHAERFGLSALHQLRGRVGRSDLQSWCFLVYSEPLTEDGKARLKVLHETTDGFRIAEEDLKIRGPGDITGIQQSGYAPFVLADPIRDAAILAEARKAAFEILGR